MFAAFTGALDESCLLYEPRKCIDGGVRDIYGINDTDVKANGIIIG